MIKDAEADPYIADNRPYSKAVTVRRFGRETRLCPPNIHTSAAYGLLNQLDQTPCIGGLTESLSNSSTRSLDFLLPYQADRIGPPVLYDPTTDIHLRRSIPVMQLPSVAHDRDIRRMLECLDPCESKGLEPLTYRGRIEGLYHGSFSFFDFNSYREMLNGDIRSLYEGEAFRWLGTRLYALQLADLLAPVSCCSCAPPGRLVWSARPGNHAL